MYHKGFLYNSVDMSVINVASRHKLIALFVCIAALFGGIFAFTTPLFWGQDELTHFARSYQLSTGKILSEKLNDGQYGDDIPEVAIAANTARTTDIINDKSPQHPHLVDAGAQYEALGAKSINGPKQSVAFTNTVVYSPVAYMPYTVAVKISSILDLSLLHTVIVMRLAGLLSYITLAAIGLFILRKVGARWILLSVALLPTALYQASVVSSDGVIIGLTFILTAAAVKASLYRQKLTVFERWTGLIAAMLLPLLKITYFPISLLVLLLPATSPAARKRWMITKVAALGVTAILVGVWNSLVSDAASSMHLIIGAAGNGFSGSDQISFILHNPLAPVIAAVATMMTQSLDYALYMIGQLSAAMVTIPGVAIGCSVISLALAVILCADKMRVNKKAYKIAAILFAVCLMTAAAIYGTLYLTFTDVGAKRIGGVQGRYFIPLIPLLLICCSVFIAKARIHIGKPQLLAHTTVALSVGSLGISVLYFIYLL